MQKHNTQTLLILSILIIQVSITSCDKKLDDQKSPLDIIVTNAFNQLDKNNKDSAILVLESIERPKEITRSSGIYYNTLGYLHYEEEKYRNGLKNYLAATTIFMKLGDSVSYAQARINTANCLMELSVYDRAAEYAQSGISILERSNDNHLKELAIAYNHLGSIYEEIENEALAYEYYQKSLQLRKITKLSLAPPLDNLGLLFYQSQKLDSALVYFNRYDSIVRFDNDSLRLGLAYLNKGRVYLHREQRHLAKPLLDTAEYIFIQKNSKSGLALVHQSMSKFHYSTNLVKAKKSAEKSFQISTNLKELDEQIATLNQLEQIAKAQDNLEEAYSLSVMRQELLDSIFHRKRLGEIYVVELSQQAENKNREVEQANLQIEQKRHQRNITLGILLVTLTILALVVIGKRKIEQLNLLLFNTNKTLQSQNNGLQKIENSLSQENVNLQERLQQIADLSQEQQESEQQIKKELEQQKEANEHIARQIQFLKSDLGTHTFSNAKTIGYKNIIKLTTMNENSYGNRNEGDDGLVLVWVFNPLKRKIETFRVPGSLSAFVSSKPSSLPNYLYASIGQSCIVNLSRVVNLSDKKMDLYLVVSELENHREKLKITRTFKPEFLNTYSQFKKNYC